MELNFLKLLRQKVAKKPATVPADVLKLQKKLTQDEIDNIKRLGIVLNKQSDMMTASTQISYERLLLYKEIDRAQLHWMVGAALELYADYATTFNPTHNATMWVTSENEKYQRELTKLLDIIQIEEHAFDWAWTCAAYGDLFARVNATPGVGITSIEDDDHPINISRVDSNGVLVGFFRTPLGGTSFETTLLPPWEYVHFRVLGVKRRRPIYGDPMFAEFRTIHILSPETRRLTSKYGTSLIVNALPIYKRLRLCEDSLMLARLTRGILKYIYMVSVDPEMTNIEAINAIMDEYATTIKRARALNSDPNSPNYDSKSNPMSMVEDIFLPIFGDVNSVKIEKVGGEPNIRWIVDIEELRNQLASALRCPVSLLGGYVQEVSGALGSDAIEKLDIRFARNARRLQRALIEGVTRLCQIHLAYIGMDPDPSLFQVNMGETSTAEEEAMKDALETGVDIVDRMMDLLDKVAPGRVDKVKALDYFNQKFLKLNDFDLEEYLKDESEVAPIGDPDAPMPGPRKGKIAGEDLPQPEVPITGEPNAEEMSPESVGLRKPKRPITNFDLLAYTPESSQYEEWQKSFGDCKIKVTTLTEKQESGDSSESKDSNGEDK